MSDEQPKKRDFSEAISPETRRKWNKLILKHPRITRRIHIIAHTKLSKPVIIRAMLDNMATPNTVRLIDEFFNTLK